MSIETTKLYQSTGFNRENIPDRSSLLTNPIVVDSVWVYQTNDIGRIRIKSTWSVVKNIDYCVIGESYYFVTDVVMMNPNTAELELSLDAVTTIGLNNIINNIAGGWCKRRCVTDDGLFKNILNEDFQPTEPLTSDSEFLEVAKRGLLVAVSTIDLDKIDHLCEVYKDAMEQSDINVAVPTVPTIDGNYTKVSVEFNGLKTTRELVGKRMYNLIRTPAHMEKYQKAIRTVWSLGLQDAITGIYYVPVGSLTSGWIGTMGFYDGVPGDATADNTAVKEVFTDGREFSTRLDFQYNKEFIFNNKVYATRYNTYRVISVASGNEASYLASEIYNRQTKPNAPSFVITIDPSEHGTARCKPETVRGVSLNSTTNEFELFRDSVTGGQWIGANINMNLPKGITKSLNQLHQESALNVMGTVGSMVGGGLPNYSGNSVWESASQPGYQGGLIANDRRVGRSHMDGGFLGRLAQPATNYATTKARINLQAANTISSPDTWFPIDDSLSNYIGNSFYIIRERLSLNDLIKFDQYLTMYGYAVNEPLTKQCFTGRQFFNYIVCENIVLKPMNSYPLRLLDKAKAQLESGIRIWHTPVTQGAFQVNPIVE